MQHFHTFSVVPALPEKLSKLRELAYNLRWSWDHETVNLAETLDQDAWNRSGHNPVLMLGMISQERLRAASEDQSFIDKMDRAYERLQSDLNDPRWFQHSHGESEADTSIAYFSAEFGITECLAIYSGGLGVLAGDHLKAASELGVPLVGVTLLYQKGYFRQYLNLDGWQQERYPANDFNNLPISLVKGADNTPVVISVDFPGRKVSAQVWKAQVGRAKLYLLDTNIPINDPRDHNITNELYGGDQETRIQQELMLGIGGLRALQAVGEKPTVYHMNEGHSAFLALERARLMMQEKGVDYETARQITSAGNVFTTHTPVPAGFDIFHPAMMQVYFEEYAKSLNMSFDDFMSLGRVDVNDKASGFNMAVLAMKHSPYVNGVSKLHGRVSREMMEPLWPGRPVSEVPVTSVTNGIHTRSWVAEPMMNFLNYSLGEDWHQQPAGSDTWKRVNDLPSWDLWKTHEYQRSLLIEFARKRLREQFEQRGMTRAEIDNVKNILDPDALTIGFARRFATYKRATLILSDRERLRKLLTSAAQPVQLIFAGKAHPKDNAGKEFLKEIVHFAREADVRNRVVFLEDYDIGIARMMVQGVDVWMNTPRRPYEASGTSGMKVVANGGLNLSVLDGWWPEGCNHETGWAIGSGEEYEDAEYQDKIEAQELYELLELEVIPLFYTRNEDNIPHGWVQKMKASLQQLAPVFNTGRMVREYTERFYLPASERYNRFSSDPKRAESLVEWRKRVSAAWPNVKIERVQPAHSDVVRAGSDYRVNAWVSLGSLSPDDVTVEIYHGNVQSKAGLTEGTPIRMELKESKDGQAFYQGGIPCDLSGLHGYTVRIVPHHPDALLPYDLNLITWEQF